MKHLKTWVAAALAMSLAGAASAALIDRGGGMNYDTTQNLTWMADMNFALTSSDAAAHGVEPLTVVGDKVIGTNGRVGGSAAHAWVANLALFLNVQWGPYWSGTAFAPWLVVAVRDGDGDVAVPEPQTLALVLMGWCAAGLLRRTGRLGGSHAR